MLKHALLQPCAFGGPIKWYEPGDRAKELLVQFPDFTFSHLEYESHAWLGGYEISYLVKDGGVLCHQCANRELERTLDPDDDQFHVVDEFINYEDPDLFCDHCNRRIEPAYGESGMKTIILHETWIGTQFPCALEYGDNTGLEDDEEILLDNWYSNLVNEAEDRYTANPVIHFEYGEQSEFETCDITGLKGNCVAVTAFILV